MLNNDYLKVDWRTPENVALRVGFGEGLLHVGDDQKVVVLTADLAGSTKVAAFEEKYPDRFFDVGVAEQNMAGVAAGLAMTGKIPFISSYAVFSPGRNFEQIRVSIALTNANVKIISSHAGLATGLNGPSHQALEDIALMRTLPNMTVIAPCDANECATAVTAAYNHYGPVYIRATRPDTPNFTHQTPFVIGKSYVYRYGKDVTICASGIQVWDALMVADELAKTGIECEVINVASIKPLDAYTIMASARKTRIVVTIEDHQIAGGMGSAITELLSETMPVHILRIGVEDTFGKSGDWQHVYEEFGLDRKSLKGRIRRFVLD